MKVSPLSFPAWFLAALFIVLLGVTDVSAQTATLRGFVTDRSDGQALQGANIALRAEDGTFLGNVADSDGFYTIARISPGRYTVQVSFIGYGTLLDTLDLTPNEILTYSVELEPGGAALDEVVVEQEREGGAAAVAAGVQTIVPRDIDRVPTPDVSGDLVSYLTTMPGIVTTGDRGGQLFIRGGEPSQNLVLFDGMPVYQPFHILGFYSAVPSEILQAADVYAGGFGARFTGRISSVIDVQTRNGNKRFYSGSASGGPFISTAILEGPVPVTNNRISFLASARVSTIEQLAAQYVAQPLPYSFGDFFGKVHAVIHDNHQASASILHTYDSGSLDEGERADDSEEVRWSNTVYGLRYLILPNKIPMLGEVLVSVSKLNTETGPRDEATRQSSIDNVNVAVNMTNYAGLSEYNWGFFIRSPYLSSTLGGLYQEIEGENNRSPNPGAYFEPDLYLGGGLHLRPGVAGQLIGQKGFFVEPRLRLLLEMGIHRWSAAGGLYRQDIVGLTDRRDVTNIFTAWTDSPLGHASQALHALVGYNIKPLPWLASSIEGFYKKLDGLYISEWTAYPRFSTNLQEANGRAYGMDLRLEVQRPNFYGFINYGLSSVRYNAMQESLIYWYGTPELSFRPSHDRRHQVNALASTTVSGFDLSVRWNFGSGLPYTQVRGFDGFILMDGPVDVSEQAGEPRVIYDRPFGGVLPTYHRLDVSVERRFEFSERGALTVQVGAINTYGRANLFALDIFTLRRTDQLPFVPTLGVKLEM